MAEDGDTAAVGNVEEPLDLIRYEGGVGWRNLKDSDEAMLLDKYRRLAVLRLSYSVRKRANTWG
jgi:hypothetical protein